MPAVQHSAETAAGSRVVVGKKSREQLCEGRKHRRCYATLDAR